MQVILYVYQFGPGKITVKTLEGVVILEGNHKEKKTSSILCRDILKEYICYLKTLLWKKQFRDCLQMKHPASE